MKLQTFTVENLADALKIATEKYGSDAEIVSTKEIVRKGLGRKGLYEVVISVPDGSHAQNSDESDVQALFSSAAKEIAMIAGVAGEQTKPRPSRVTPPQTPSTPALEPKISPSKTATTPLKEQEELVNLQKQIAKLTERVKSIQHMVWDNTIDTKTMPIPPEFSEIYRVSRQSGMQPEHLDAIMRLTLDNMPINMRQDSLLVRRYFNTLLRQMVPVRREARLARPSKKVIMLVGPTGVGKTTAIAKLAAHYAMDFQEKYKVGLITLDTYRIGAVEQLARYAQMMRIGIERVDDPINLGSTIAALRHCDFILIDTAGSSQHDKEKIIHISQFLNSEKSTTIDVMLVLSANSKSDDLRDIYRSYEFLGIDSIVATKLDETRTLGTLFSFLYEHKKPLSYLSIGQEVPEDLMPAEAEYFIGCLLDGFRKERELV
ncbi:flagellar biosynthesis protein FlhF [Campylobacterota bacterium]|nr:flagellar biosynthesis protein FlhF [Campylobacterota bacterium]